MRSRLPPRLEEIRLQIAGAHNTVVVLAGLPLMVMFFAYVFMTGPKMVGREHDAVAVAAWVFPIALLVIGGLVLLVWFVKWNDDRLCKEAGFVCRKCGKPLYASDSPRLLAGLCPHCGQEIVDEPVVLSA